VSEKLKIGVKIGGGPHPGYLWNVAILDFAFEEVMEFCTIEQYQHLAMQVQELAREVDPTHPVTVKVKSIGSYYEICDKGGILGKKNVRIFFWCC
jgi:hypothetical protein